MFKKSKNSKKRKFGLYNISCSKKLKGDGNIYLHQYKFLPFVTLYYPNNTKTIILTQQQARLLRKDKRLEIKKLL